MNKSQGVVGRWFQEVVSGWDRFWFTPIDSATLGLIRICAGAMLLYSHAVWTVDLEGWFGGEGRLSPEFSQLYHGSQYAWSHLYFDMPSALLWTLHLSALVVFAMLMIGLFTRPVSIVAFLLAVSYAHRMGGAEYGLDRINVTLAFCLMIGASGSAYSIDAWRRKRKTPDGSVSLSTSSNIAIRLLQIHMCVIYLFAGISKLQGETWWDGTALWLGFANYEYQSFDMTWTSDHPALLALLVHITVFWEVFYVALVWPRITRYIAVAVSIPLHVAIAVCMGIIPFALSMLVGNYAFVSPQLTRKLVNGVLFRGTREQTAVLEAA